MINENELAMVVAFYLSKFGDGGLEKLGFFTYKQAFETIGRSLNVNPNSVNNWRDEFDPYYDNGRKGWYQRNIRPSRLKVIEKFDDLSEDALRAVALDIINLEGHKKVEIELAPAIKEIKDLENKRKKINREFIARGPTGRMAEDFFTIIVIELATQEKKDPFTVLKEIVQIYNKRLEEVETDLSLRIEVK